jgi:2-desacetyl-2-hydroxyethyl bacteriochlorophyllide A dehydrogenase
VAANQTVVLEAPRRLQLHERAIPTAAAGEVVVRVAATAVCGTDLEIYTGRHPGVNYPVVMGHETTGVVAEVGSGVANLQPGQPVLINPIIACGHCDSCTAGRENLCRNAGLFGREIEGSLSEYVCLPARYIHVLPKHLPLAEATLIETLATVRHAQNRTAITAGESVVVIGQGTTGLLHTRLAVLAGADPVIAISRSQWKLDMATKMGAHHVVAQGAAEAIADVQRLTNNAGADVIIDTAGAPEMIKAGMEMLRPGGRYCAFAVSHVPVEDFSTFPLYFKEVSIIGSRALLPEDMDPCIELVASGQVDVSGFVTCTYPLQDTPPAFEEFERNSSQILRIVIDSS